MSDRTIDKLAGKVSHTPGPWHYVPAIRQVVVKEWVNNPFMGDYRGCVIADFNAAVGHGTEAHSRDFAVPEAEANARLIAAAPELLEALKAIHQFWSQPPDGSMWRPNEMPLSPHALITDSEETIVSVVKAAIAKAEGR